MVKCFSCSNEAVAIVNTCSPTSDTGMTEPRPRCEACIANMKGVNILSLLIPTEEFSRKMDRLVKWGKTGCWVTPEKAEQWQREEGDNSGSIH